MMSKSSLTVATALTVAAIAILWAMRASPAIAQSPQPVLNAGTNGARFSVASQVLPGQVSITLLYVTDTQTNKLYIYRAVGGLDTSFNRDPELYRTYDLTSAGQQNLVQAK